MYMYVLPACMYIYSNAIWMPMELEESWILPRTEIKGIYELPYECWEPNPGPLQE